MAPARQAEAETNGRGKAKVGWAVWWSGERVGLGGEDQGAEVSTRALRFAGKLEATGRNKEAGGKDPGVKMSPISRRNYAPSRAGPGDTGTKHRQGREGSHRRPGE